MKVKIKVKTSFLLETKRATDGMGKGATQSNEGMILHCYNCDNRNYICGPTEMPQAAVTYVLVSLFNFLILI